MEHRLERVIGLKEGRCMLTLPAMFAKMIFGRERSEE
jgi:hypothetical protein